jgi:hypothetical protein
MEQRDFLVRQAEIFGQVLGKLLARLLEINESQEIIAEGNQALTESLGLNINDLISLDNEELLNRIINDKYFSLSNIEQLADILFVLANNSGDPEQTTLREKCLLLYQFLEKEDNAYSFNREWKIGSLIK